MLYANHKNKMLYVEHKKIKTKMLYVKRKKFLNQIFIFSLTKDTRTGKPVPTAHKSPRWNVGFVYAYRFQESKYLQQNVGTNFEDLTRFLKKIVVGLMQLFAQIFDLVANICYWSDRRQANNLKQNKK